MPGGLVARHRGSGGGMGGAPPLWRAAGSSGRQGHCSLQPWAGSGPPAPACSLLVPRGERSGRAPASALALLCPGRQAGKGSPESVPNASASVGQSTGGAGSCPGWVGHGPPTPGADQGGQKLPPPGGGSRGGSREPALTHVLPQGERGQERERATPAPASDLAGDVGQCWQSRAVMPQRPPAC